MTDIEKSMSRKDAELSPIKLIEDGPDWEIWEHYDRSGKIIFSRVIITSLSTTPHLTILAQDVEIPDRAAEYVPRIIEGLGLGGKDWYLDLYSSKPIGTWCAEGKNYKNILRLE